MPYFGWSAPRSMQLGADCFNRLFMQLQVTLANLINSVFTARKA